MSKEEFIDIIGKLKALGENSIELDYWQDVFEYLEEDGQKEIFKTMQDELEALVMLEGQKPVMATKA